MAFGFVAFGFVNLGFVRFGFVRFGQVVIKRIVTAILSAFGRIIGCVGYVWLDGRAQLCRCGGGFRSYRRRFWFVLIDRQYNLHVRTALNDLPEPLRDARITRQQATDQPLAAL